MTTEQDLENIGVEPTCETVNIHLCWCHEGALQIVCDLCLIAFFGQSPFLSTVNVSFLDWNCKHQNIWDAKNNGTVKK